MNTNFLFHGNLLKYETISREHKEKEKKILNKVQERRMNYLKLSQGFTDAYSTRKKLSSKSHFDD